jgi:hypothetical protein
MRGPRALMMDQPSVVEKRSRLAHVTTRIMNIPARK